MLPCGRALGTSCQSNTHNTLFTAIHCIPFGPVFPGSPVGPGGPTTGCFPLFRPSRTEKHKTNYNITPSYLITIYLSILLNYWFSGC